MAPPIKPASYEVSLEEFLSALDLQKYMNPDFDKREVGGLTEREWKKIWNRLDMCSRTLAFLILGVGLNWRQAASEAGTNNPVRAMERLKRAIQLAVNKERLVECS